MDSRTRRSKLAFQVDHLSSVTCDVTAIEPETLLTDFIRKSAVGVDFGPSIICDILVESHDILVVEKPSNVEIERWPIESIKRCKHLPIQPAVFPNRYNNALTITTSTEIHLFNVLNIEANKVAELINDEVSSYKPEGSPYKSPPSERDYDNVDFSLESNSLNRCFDDIENVINRMQQNSIEFQKFTERWNQLSNQSSKGKHSKNKDFEKQKAAELAAVTANQVPSAELMDTLQKIKLALIIVGRIRFSLESSSVTGAQYVNMLLSPLTAIVTTTSQPPLSASPFDYVKSIDAPLFRRDIISFILESIPQTQVPFWKMLGEAWNIPLEEWRHELRPYRPVFKPDNYSPYLPFLDPAVIRISLANAKTESGDRSYALSTNAVYGIVPNNVVNAQIEHNSRGPSVSHSGKTNSISSDSHPPLEIQELDDVIAAADIAEAGSRIRPFSDEEFMMKLFSQNKRVVRAKRRHQSNDLTELSVEEGEIVEVIGDADKTLIIGNIFGETGHAPSNVFEEVLSSSVKVNSGAKERKLDLTGDPTAASEHRHSSQNDHMTSSDTESSVNTKNQNGPAFEEQIFTNFTPLTVGSDSPDTNKRQGKKVTRKGSFGDDRNNNDEGAHVETVAMKPKDQAPDSLIPMSIPDKDYELPPDWLKPKKQNAFAAHIRKAGGRIVHVVRPREAQRSEELSVYLDELLELLETPTGAWWKVRNAVKRVGYVPLNYLQEMEFVKATPPVVESERSPNRSPARRTPKNSTSSTQKAAVAVEQPTSAVDEPPNPDSPGSPTLQLSNWKSQPELVIVEQPSETYQNYLMSRRRGSYGNDMKPQFGAPLLAPFTSKTTGNPRFEEARQKAASVLSLMISSQVTRFSSSVENSSVSPAAEKYSSPFSVSPSAVHASTSVATSDVSVRLAISNIEEGNTGRNSGNNGDDAGFATSGASSAPVVVGDIDYQSITVTGNVVSESGLVISSQQAPASVRSGDLRHVRENMDRLTDQLNSLAANGKLGPSAVKSNQKPLELRGKTSKKVANPRLNFDSSSDDVRKYLMYCGFSPLLVQEFGLYSGEQLFAKKTLADFEQPSLSMTETKRLFHLVQGARALAGVATNRSAKAEFENKVINRRSGEKSKTNAAENKNE